MNPEIAQMKAMIAELAAEVKRLKSATTISKDVDSAFRNRLGINDLQAKLTDSGVAVSTISQSVNEAGAASYSVLAQPDYLLRMKYLNLTVGIPAYDF